MDNKIQKSIDCFWDKTLFRILPKKFSPNLFTLIRFILIPAIVVFVVMKNFLLALLAFILASLCDTIDGSLARKRNLITPLGTLLDSVADKLLVLMLLLFLAFYYPNPILLLSAVFFDVMTVLGGSLIIVFFGADKLSASNLIGKSKMLFQVLSILSIIAFMIWELDQMLYLSYILLYISITLGFLSFITYSLNSLQKIIKE